MINNCCTITSIIQNSINLRFKQPIFPLLCMIEQFLLQTVNGSETVDETNTIGLNDVREFLADDVDAEKFQRELTMLPDYLSVIRKEKKMALKKIPKISTICEVLNTQSIGKSMFSEFSKVLSLYLTIPVTTATTE
ncbi:unnamed protein product [Rotaria socialis]|uniref:Uncharacterized protein n=1 Tax=Rotaria socialis TaxID=392032 RepID=A0A820JXB7_9BILA|nr:unnamed protein product [Rotaria socialis]CAF3473508.1 unnamed protein product [Rotaria socialis]CAF4332713.1 unnamed protein product [Rotaria socialis]CAF4504283.1 unnamed protein product [Rotaria socialis]